MMRMVYVDRFDPKFGWIRDGNPIEEKGARAFMRMNPWGYRIRSAEKLQSELGDER